MRIGIIGAGIVGVCVAHALLDEGHDVEWLDARGIGNGTSFGHAGWVAHLDILPLASPRVWRNLPRWAFDPLGPLAIRPRYLPQLLPWLARFVAASRPGRIEESTRAISALNGRALGAWQRRLAAAGLSDLLRPRGLLSVWASPAGWRAAAPLLQRQREVGVEVQALDPADIRALEPALGPSVVAGALYPAGCHISDPKQFVDALAAVALSRGARFVPVAVEALLPEADRVELKTRDGQLRGYDRVVLAAGAWSKPLAASAGDAVPLDTERGYNVTLPPGRLGLTRPVMYEGLGFVTTPLDTGDRVGGSVEFAGLDAAPNFRRVDAILGRLRKFLPDADLTGGTRWMGFRPSTPDSLPVIGAATRDRRIVYAFGHAHHGLTQAAVTAEIVADLLADRPTSIDPAPYSPRRFAERF